MHSNLLVFLTYIRSLLVVLIFNGDSTILGKSFIVHFYQHILSCGYNIYIFASLVTTTIRIFHAISIVFEFVKIFQKIFVTLTRHIHMYVEFRLGELVDVF